MECHTADTSVKMYLDTVPVPTVNLRGWGSDPAIRVSVNAQMEAFLCLQNGPKHRKLSV